MKPGNLDDLFETGEEIKLSKMSAKDLMMKYVYHYPYFIASLSAVLLVAFLYLRYAVPIYRVTSTLLIKDEKGGGRGGPNEDLESIVFSKQSINLDNEIEILYSYRTLEDGKYLFSSQKELARIQELAGMPPSAMPAVQEAAGKNWLDNLYYDFKENLPHDIDDDEFLSRADQFLRSQGVDPDQIESIGELFLDLHDHEEDDDHDYANQLDREQYDDEPMMEDTTGKEIDYDSLVVDGINTWDYPDFVDAYFASGEYMDGTPIPDEVLDKLTSDSDLLQQHINDKLYEAEYQGREVPLGKPMKGDVKKSKVYVKGPKGNVVKVNFGDKTMRIKKSNPKRRKSFRARHHCANPGPRTKARYWACRKW